MVFWAWFKIKKCCFTVRAIILAVAEEWFTLEGAAEGVNHSGAKWEFDAAAPEWFILPE